jgi:3-phenylpropionate/trans-cinnamate dioxygenase ferredoxin subunit
MAEKWVEAGLRADLKEGVPRAVFPKGLPVLLILRGEEVFALENRCPHMGCPLSAGKLEGLVLQCPCHDWRFDIRDGRFLDAPELAVKTYSAEIKDGKILVKVSIT